MQCGYSSSLAEFTEAHAKDILSQLQQFVPDAGDSQITAWRDSIKILQRILTIALSDTPALADHASIILEYTVPMESRRIDALVLLKGAVVVIEFKGKAHAPQADIDQAAAYARDLRAYHRACANVPTVGTLLLTRTADKPVIAGEVTVQGQNDLASYLQSHFNASHSSISLDDFLSDDVYQPLPSLIKAARELFSSGTIRRIHRAAMATEPTLNTCSRIVHQTATQKRRALILICGVPGAGKTLVGLQLAHAKFLDDLAVARSNGEKPTSAAVFLSGNGPLVEVLQYELLSAGGDGRAFVRGVHDYVGTFTRRAGLVPPQHVLIYDEAQRAFDAAQVAAKHPNLPSAFHGLSEPELFIQFAERVPEWCVVVGLIGSGQEIHIGEEAGIAQWRSAIAKSADPAAWDIFLPDEADLVAEFAGLPRVAREPTLALSETIRFHLATRLYEFVSALLDGHTKQAREISVELEKSGYNLRITHDLDRAKTYLSDRYSQNPDARYGMVASSKDKDLVKFGVPKGFKTSGEVGPGKYGRWYSDPIDAQGSCTQLTSVATEFGSQGLELDACLLAWGTDLVRIDGAWSNAHASGYKEKHRIRDARTLRINAYRVLLTRGRDGCVIFVPPIPDKMRETYSYLRDCGFTELKDAPE